MSVRVDYLLTRPHWKVTGLTLFIDEDIFANGYETLGAAAVLLECVLISVQEEVKLLQRLMLYIG